MNYPAAELTGYQTALTALFFEAKLRGIHPKGLKDLPTVPKGGLIGALVFLKSRSKYHCCYLDDGQESI
jgi:hypothetical protein